MFYAVLLDIKAPVKNLFNTKKSHEKPTSFFTRIVHKILNFIKNRNHFMLKLIIIELQLDSSNGIAE